MAGVYHSTTSLPTRRAVYNYEEDKSMWDFYVQKVRKRNPDALARRASLWAEYTMTSNTKRTYQALEKHFRDILLPRIDNAPIDDEDVILILELCKVSLADNDAQRNLKRRLRKLCELTIAHPSLFVQRVTRLEKRSQACSSALFNPPNYPPPVFVPDTQASSASTVVSNKILQKETQKDEIVDESFRCVNPNQTLDNDQGYLKFIKEVTSGRLQPQLSKFVQPKLSPKKQALHKTTSWSSITSGEYLMDLSNSPVRLKTLTEEQSENSEDTQQYETAPSQPVIPSTNALPTIVVSDSEENAQLSDRSNGSVMKEKIELTLIQEDQHASTSNPSFDRVTQLELQWHKQLTQKNKDNKGLTSIEVLQCKELLRTRIKLTAKGMSDKKRKRRDLSLEQQNEIIDAAKKETNQTKLAHYFTKKWNFDVKRTTVQSILKRKEVIESAVEDGVSSNRKRLKPAKDPKLDNAEVAQASERRESTSQRRPSQDGIPDNVKGMVAEFAKLLKWCLTETASPTKSI